MPLVGLDLVLVALLARSREPTAFWNGPEHGASDRSEQQRDLDQERVKTLRVVQRLD
jgi:hypothetical protein